MFFQLFFIFLIKLGTYFKFDLFCSLCQYFCRQVTESYGKSNKNITNTVEEAEKKQMKILLTLFFNIK